MFLTLLARGIDPTHEKKARRLQSNMGEFAQQYLDEVAVRKKPNTVTLEKSVLHRHITPLLGKKKLANISKRDVQKFMLDVVDGKTVDMSLLAGLSHAGT